MITPYIDELTQLPVISYETVIDNDYNLTQEEVKYFVNFILAEEVKNLVEMIIELYNTISLINDDNLSSECLLYYNDKISSLRLFIDISLDDKKNNEDFWKYINIDLEEAIMRKYKVMINLKDLLDNTTGDEENE